MALKEGETLGGVVPGFVTDPDGRLSVVGDGGGGGGTADGPWKDITDSEEGEFTNGHDQILDAGLGEDLAPFGWRNKGTTLRFRGLLKTDAVTDTLVCTLPEDDRPLYLQIATVGAGAGAATLFVTTSGEVHLNNPSGADSLFTVEVDLD